MKKDPADLSWMPAPEEWDFRAMTAKESRPACWWEYARSVPGIVGDVEEWQNWGGRESGFVSLIWFSPLAHSKQWFPTPWLSILQSDRDDMSDMASTRPVTVRPVSELKESIRRLVQYSVDRGETDPLKIIERVLKVKGRSYGPVFLNGPSPPSYVLHANFSAAGSEAVINAFTSWARQEAKKFPRRKVAKAAEPPFDCLKWLSAYRLERARRAAGVSFNEVQLILKEHQHTRPILNSSPVLPIYASHGAWSKAKGDAERKLHLLESDPKAFEASLF